MLRRCVLLSLLAFMVSGVGCSQSLKKFDLTVRLDPAVQERGRQTEVDVIAVSDPASLESISVSDYFTTGSPYRQSLKNSGDVWSVVLDPNNPEMTLKARDPIWTKQWKNAEHLFILADILNVRPQGGVDPRRIKRSRAWVWDKDVTATVGTSRISLNPEPKPAD